MPPRRVATASMGGRDNRVMSQLHVRDLMTSSVVAVQGAETLETVWDLMVRRHIRHIPVVDRAGRLIGLVSHRDLMRESLVAPGALPETPERDLRRQVLVAEVLRGRPLAVSPDTPLAQAARTLLERKFGCLPVVEGRRLVGIITEADFVRQFAEAES